jgi:hypothetical protein
MDCHDCPRFDIEANRCRDGKVNPRTYEQSFQIAKHIGLRAICVLNDHRERLVEARRPASPKRRTSLRP